MATSRNASKTTARLRLEPLDRRDVPAVVVPELQSNPGAPYTILLDFDGSTVDKWGNPWPFEDSPGTIPPFSIDADEQDTSPEEYLAMGRAWNYVAEDYAPFNVNVTTVNPYGSRSPGEGEGVRVIVGGSWRDWLGDEAHGVAMIDDFHDDGKPKVFVFSESILADGWTGNMLAKRLGDVASHEVGHAIGLEHQSKFGEPRVVNTFGTPGLQYPTLR